MFNMTKRYVAVILLCVTLIFMTISLTACGKDGIDGRDGTDGVDGLTPTIGENGNWWIGDYDTGVRAEAQAGTDGKNGIDGKDGVNGKDGSNGKDGVDGKDGKDAITPKFLYNNGMIYVSYDNEVSWDLLVEIDELIEDGKDGKDGISITSCELNDQGELIIHYSTGESSNLGRIVGTDGIDGNNGENGINGKDGISIDSCEINDNGELVISYSDGTDVNLGKVVGTNGTNGSNGTNGTDGKNGVDGVTPRFKINTSTRQWEVSYDNGETWEALGVIATGADGTNGENGLDGQNGTTPRLKIDTATNQWHVSYDDGKNWESLGVVATGPAGNDGMATIVKIGDDGYWYTSRNNGTSWENTGVKAEGSDGENGDNGNDGRGIEKMEIIEGCLWVTYTDSQTPVNIGRVIAENDGEESGPVIVDQYTDALSFYPLGDGSEYGVSVGNALYMENIVIPSTYNGKPVTTILPRAFVRVDDTNTTLKNIFIPDSIVCIGENAFDNCVALTNLIIPSSVKVIGDYAFANVSIVTFDISESEVPEDQVWSEGTLGCGEIVWKK